MYIVKSWLEKHYYGIYNIIMRAVVEWLSVELWIMMTQVRYSTRAASKKLGNFSFTPHCPSSLSCIDEYLAIDSDGLCERKVYRAVIPVRLNASQRSWTCVCKNRSARRVIASALNGQVDWILHVKQLTCMCVYDVYICMYMYAYIQKFANILLIYSDA